MKRINLFFLTLLATLLVTTNAWGDTKIWTLVTNIETELTDGAYIYLKTDATNSDSDPKTPYFNGDDAKVSTQSEKQVYQLVADGSKFKLCRVTDSKYLAKATSTSAALSMTDNASDAETFSFSQPMSSSATGYVAGTDPSKMIRFTASTYDTYLNAQGDKATAKYANGKGTWSVWSVYVLNEYDLSQINFTFSNKDNTWAGITTTITDKSEKVIPGVTATLEFNQSGVSPKTGEDLTEAMICPNVNTWVENSTADYIITLSVSGLPTDFEFNNVVTKHIAVNGQGKYQTPAASRNTLFSVTANNQSYSSEIIQDINKATVESNKSGSENTIVFPYCMQKQNDGFATIAIKIIPIRPAGCFYALTGIQLTKSNYSATIQTGSSLTSFYLDKATEIPSDCKAYYAVYNSERKVVVLSEAENYVAANQAVIVTGNPGTYTFAETTESVTSPSNNDLCGSMVNIAMDEKDETKGYYYLSTSGQFCPYTWETQTLESKTFPVGRNRKANKAYLYLDESTRPYDTSSEAKGLSIVFNDDPTSIYELVDGQLIDKNAPIYNLGGQRINKLQKGVNIVNGRKVLY